MLAAVRKAMPVLRHTVLGLLLASPAAWAGTDTLLLLSDPWCPFACEPDSPLPGFMIDIAKAVFEPRHKVVYQVEPFARADGEVAAGQAQGLVGALKLPRRASFHYPEREQGIANVCFYTRPDSTWLYHGRTSLQGVLVGATLGYNYGREVGGILRERWIKLDTVGSSDALHLNIEKLLRGRIDTVVEYGPVMSFTLSRGKVKLRNAGCTSVADPIYIAFSPKLTEGERYARELSEGMERLRRSGELKRILARYGLTDWAVAR
jgi:polar amino acid transport system substrate-binding protein